MGPAMRTACVRVRLLSTPDAAAAYRRACEIGDHRQGREQGRREKDRPQTYGAREKVVKIPVAARSSAGKLVGERGWEPPAPTSRT